MNDLAILMEKLWIDIALHLWQAALFVGLLALAARAMQRCSARLLSMLYWIGIAKLMLPLPWLGSWSGRLLDFAAAGAATSGAAGSGWGKITVLIYPLRIEPAEASALPAALWITLTSIWSIGCGICVLRRLRAGGSSDSRPVDSSDPLLVAAMADAELAANAVRLSSTVGAPCVEGRTRPVIVLPERLIASLRRDELAAVLVHEREHLRRRDTLRYEILFGVRALFWFYPPVWWLARRIRQSTEMACDEAVIRAGYSAAEYCRSLARTIELGLIHGGAVSPVGILGHRVSFLGQRIQRIRSERRFEIMPTHRMTLAAAALAALVLSLLPIAPTQTLLAKNAPNEDLERLADADLPVMFNFEATEPAKILEALSRASGVEFEIIGPLPDRPVTIEVGKSRLVDALERLGRSANLRYRVLTPHRLEVRPVSLAGQNGVTAPRILSRVKPAYPAEARKDRLEGKVILQAVIGADGVVEEVEVLQSNSALFNDAAMDAVREWLWEPATSDGEPVSVFFTIVVEFSLDESKKSEI